MENFKQKLPRIKTLLFDVDGVLTNGQVFLLENGEFLRNMNSKDGYALQLAVRKGYRIAMITGGSSQIVKKALHGLGIQDVFLSQHDKLQCYKDYVNEHNLKEEEILYMGDDLPDYEVMKRVGIATCPFDSATEIKEICLYISSRKGGEGCVRDVVEQVLRSQQNWEITGW
ncbi:MAG: 3-deoxy-D-manno-octulosonate 8-phosphate phosphatase [Bacteroidota bacterium]|jgi:3-deoxy-D-manno-octulosonate 8-phosphate phosphatase (KDO 8-P phosphatase)|nr:3-deoxy-D-manno-octulosonate 8-phosphate phosphatase [Bacteroidota bacterium]